ncbi:MAG: hypothetical protein M3O70_25750 [Actinomycetota bacterium]|nr:hypothetical protein [Actinomycetota bacterium]
MRNRILRIVRLRREGLSLTEAFDQTRPGPDQLSDEDLDREIEFVGDEIRHGEWAISGLRRKLDELLLERERRSNR